MGISVADALAAVVRLISAPLGKASRVRGKRVQAMDRQQLGELSEALRRDAMADYVAKYPGG